MTDADMSGRVINQSFRPRARVLQLLGDELIGNARLAVFELVKNAYDADANEVVIRLELATQDEPAITVADDGEGMSLDVLRSVWLVPGHDHRRQQRQGRRAYATASPASARREGTRTLSPSTNSATASLSPHGPSTAMNVSWTSTGTS